MTFVAPEEAPWKWASCIMGKKTKTSMDTTEPEISPCFIPCILLFLKTWHLHYPQCNFANEWHAASSFQTHSAQDLKTHLNVLNWWIYPLIAKFLLCFMTLLKKRIIFDFRPFCVRDCRSGLIGPQISAELLADLRPLALRRVVNGTTPNYKSALLRAEKEPARGMINAPEVKVLKAVLFREPCLEWFA